MRVIWFTLAMLAAGAIVAVLFCAAFAGLALMLATAALCGPCVALFMVCDHYLTDKRLRK